MVPLFLNTYIGVTNLVTSSTKEGDLVRNVVRSTPLKRLLLENDAPYFLPKEEKKYKICHPPLARYVAKKIAELKCTVTVTTGLDRVNYLYCSGLSAALF